jgi:hypothetical protein
VFLFVAALAVYATAILIVGKLRPASHGFLPSGNDAPAHTLASFPDCTRARTKGTVRNIEELLRAPFTSRPCVYYSVVVEDADEEGWHVCGREEACSPFLLEDGVSHALVEPEHRDVIVEWSYETAFPNEAQRRRFAHFAHRIPGNRHRYREAIIAPGQPVVVIGDGAREPDPDPRAAFVSYREPSHFRLKISGTPRAPVIIAARPEFLLEPSSS